MKSFLPRLRAHKNVREDEFVLSGHMVPQERHLLFRELDQTVEQTHSEELLSLTTAGPATTRLTGSSLCTRCSAGDLIAPSHFSANSSGAKFTVRFSTKHKTGAEEQAVPDKQRFLRALSHKLNLCKLCRAYMLFLWGEVRIH